MPLTAPASFLAEVSKWRDVQPRFYLEIQHGSVFYNETTSVVETGAVDRLMEKWDSPGVSLAGDMQVVLSNKDGRFSPKEDTSPFWPEGLLGDVVRFYILFGTDTSPLLMSPSIGMTTSLGMMDTLTEKVLYFTGNIEEVRPRTDGSAVLVLRDSIMELLNGAYTVGRTVPSAGTEDPATMIRDIIINDAGLTVDDACYTATQGKVASIQCKLEIPAGMTYMAAIQEITRATGLSVFSGSEGKLCIFAFYPSLDDFTKFGFGDASDLFTMSGDVADRDQLNVLSGEGGVSRATIRNRVILDYIDINTGAAAQVDRQAQASNGDRVITLDTTLQMDPSFASIWPARLLSRYSEPRRIYRIQTSLKEAILNVIGDFVRFTDPVLREVRALFLVRQAALDLLSTTVQMELEDLDDIDGVKFAWVGSDIVEPDGNRISALMDHLHNKSLESAVNPGVDDTPEKYTITPPGGGTFTFQRSENEASTGRYSGRLVISNSSGGKAVQIISLRPLVAATGTNYTLTLKYKGTVTAGSALVRVKTNGGTVRGTITINTTATDWTLMTVTFGTITGDATPYLLEIEPGSGADDLDIFLDDIQIDDGASAYSFQENWKIYAMTGEDEFQTFPGFDADGNQNNVINGLSYLEGFEELPKVVN